MAKSTPTKAAAAEPQQPDAKELATELFLRAYHGRQGYTLESSAEKAIEDAEAFLEILHR